jgi:hypothetical protein
MLQQQRRRRVIRKQEFAARPRYRLGLHYTSRCQQPCRWWTGQESFEIALTRRTNGPIYAMFWIVCERENAACRIAERRRN